MQVDPTLFLLSVVFSIISGILIILLLAVQSWVLVKLLPEIKKVSKNSDRINDFEKDPLSMLKAKPVTVDPYSAQKTFGINCKNLDRNHIHTKECFN